MVRLFKPARSKDVGGRGIFSYITELIFNMLSTNIDSNAVKLYCDFSNTPPYISKLSSDNNFFNYIYQQDCEDYLINKHLYKNIEDMGVITQPIFSSDYWETLSVRKKAKDIINYHLVFLPDLQRQLDIDSSNIDFTNTIAVFRRAYKTHWDIVPIEKYYEILDKVEYSKILLVCDSKEDTELFKNRYGDRIICLDNFSGSAISVGDFFENKVNKPDPYYHVREMVKNTYLMSRCKKLIKIKSNITAFALFLNEELEFIDLTDGEIKYFK